MTHVTRDAPTDTDQEHSDARWTGPDELLPLLVPIDDLRPLPGNPRRGDTEAVARSLDRFGQRKPITALPDGTVTAGNHTREGALRLGWTHLAVVTIDEDAATAKAWALADNRTSDLATNDDDDLAAMLAEIAEADRALLDAASYTDDDLEALLARIDAGVPEPDAGSSPAPERDPSPWVPDPPAPRSEPVTVSVLQGDSRDVLADLPEASIDSIVTDPPYGLEFMGKDWDSFRVDERSARWAGNERTGGAGAGFAGEADGQPYDSLPAYGRRRTTNECRACGKRDAFRNAQPCPQVADSTNHDWVAVPVDPVPIEMRAFQNWCYQWAVEAYRVLKPGGHLVAFGGSRTYHRLASALEDAGFEIRDSLHWMYGSGFPKSLDVSKQIDKAAGAERPVVGTDTKARSTSGKSALPTVGGETVYETWDVTAPATDEAKRWQGWGTGLKPSHEPIVLARKPLDGTVAATVQKWGTGALNIDACRSPLSPEDAEKYERGSEAWTEHGERHGNGNKASAIYGVYGITAPASAPPGRWPANVLLSHAAGCTPDGCGPACPVAALDAQSGVTRSTGGEADHRPSNAEGPVHFLGDNAYRSGAHFDDEGGASRFFSQSAWGGEDAGMPVMVYVPKPSTAERNAGLDNLPAREVNEALEPGDAGYDNPRAGAGRGGAQANFHPTVKPVALMRWLVRLVTPPGGTVLEPFTGSGTTLVAAVLEGFDSVGVELTGDYVPIIEARVAWAQAQCPVGTSEA